MQNNTEVLVIPQYDASSIYDGFTEKKDLNSYITNALFVSKDVAEGNNLLRQIVPYVIYEHKDKYLVGSYIKDGKRKLCLGIYKHLFNDNSFTTVEDYILKNFEAKKIKFIGFVKDNLNYADHIGCVFLSKDKDFRQRMPSDKFCEKYKWKTKRELINEYGSYEIWSKNIIDNYILKKGLNSKL